MIIILSVVAVALLMKLRCCCSRLIIHMEILYNELTYGKYEFDGGGRYDGRGGM